jgi:hypothetical protein
MSELKVNKVTPRSGTTVTLGDSGDTITIPSGATLDVNGIDFPTADGTAGQVLQTDGSGVLSFATPASGIGTGQTWQSVTRVNGTTYTNSTGKPIMLVILIAVFGAGTFILNINGVGFTTITNPSGTSSSISVIIPDGNTYSYTGTAGNAFLELR